MFANHSIRMRLTLWYALILLAGLSLFALSIWLSLNHSLQESVNDTLNDRIQGVHQFMNLQIEALSLDEIRDEFREHSILGPGGDLFQVSDSNGNWLYRSSPLAQGEVPIPHSPGLPPQGTYSAQSVLGKELRFLTKPVEVHGKKYFVQVGAVMGEVQEAIHSFQVTLLVLIPAVLLAACSGGYWISRHALNPVDQIIHNAESISAENLERRLEIPPAGDELTRLSHTINKMLDRLESAFRQITRFTADASHELRTPISLISTTAEVALLKKREAPEYEEALQQILIESERTTALIEKLLTLARADSGQQPAHFQQLDLREELRDPIAQARLLAESHGLQFKANLPADSMLMRGDPDLLQRMTLILLENAVKYTPSPGIVSFSLSKEAEEVILEINDTGIGIAAADLPHIFERFYRADKARGHGGTGLGLAIAQWIASQHQAEIQVESAPAKGSRFKVIFSTTHST
jgi:heavy metal sensor kinase